MGRKIIFKGGGGGQEKIHPWTGTRVDGDHRTNV